jgi:uncharacterized protein
VTEIDETSVEGDGEDGDAALAATAVAVATYLAKSVVEDASAVRIEVDRVRDRKVRVSVHAAPNDFGRLIGRRGRVAAAIRTVVGAAASKDGFEAEVEFVE